MQKRYQTMVAPIRFNRKPTKKEIGHIKTQLIYTGTTYEEILENVAQPNGYGYMPAIIRNASKSSAHIESQQAFLLDFDSGFTVDEVLERFASFQITPNLFYTTFSHTEEHPRFRVVLLCDEVINDPATIDHIRNALKKLFPEADQSCFDRPRLFYGGQTSIPITNEPVANDKLIQMADLVTITHDHGKTRQIVSGRVPLYNYNKGYTPRDNFSHYKEYLEKLKDNKCDFEKLASRVKIFNDFINGKWLYHQQLFGLAVSLHWLKGGKKLFNETMDKYNKMGKTNYDKYKFSLVNYASLKGYFPMQLKDYSPYEDDWQYHNLITALRLPIGQVHRIGNQIPISMEEANHKFDEAFKSALESEDNRIYIFKMPPGFGKSTRLTQLKGMLMAFPTHPLKSEIYPKMVHPTKVSPEVPKFECKTLNQTIQKYYGMGLNDAATAFIHSIANNADQRYSIHDSQLAQQFWNDVSYMPDKDTNLLLTHQRAIMANYPNDCIIFDEDPIKDLLSVKKTTFDDLILLNAHLPRYCNIQSLVDEVQNAEPGKVYEIHTEPIDRKVLVSTMERHQTKSNVAQMLYAFAFIRNSNHPNQISYITKRDLHPNKKYIVLSATAQGHLYERLYPGRVTVLDLSNIPLEGTVRQHTDYSYSRTSLTPERIRELNEKIGCIQTITFKNTKDGFIQAVNNMHYGNVLGYNGLEGSDIAVVGTPHLNDAVYRLMAYAVGVNPNQEGQMKTRQVRYKDFIFCFMTFESAEIQNIQLGLIESELIQAVGRARPLRNDCVVELYSNLPLGFSEIKQ